MTFIAYPTANPLNYLLLEDVASKKQAKKMARILLTDQDTTVPLSIEPVL